MSTTPTNYNPYQIPNQYQNIYQVPQQIGQTTSTQESSGSSQASVEDTADAELSRLISGVAEQYGNQVFNWANSQIAPNTALTNQAVGTFMNAANQDFNLANSTQA